MLSEQIRAARALLRWEQRDLANSSGLSIQAIKRIEGAHGEISVRQSTHDKITNAFTDAGIEFIPENGGGPGVRLRR